MVPNVRRTVACLAIAAAVMGALAGIPGRAQPDGCKAPEQLLDRDACWWATYADPYTGITVDYPADLLRPQPSYGIGGAQRFVSSDGAVALTVWGSQVTDKLTAMEALATDIYRSGYEKVSVQKADDTGYTLGGLHGARLSVKRVDRPDAGARFRGTACITWPADRGEAWQTLAGAIVATLRQGRGWALNPRLPDSAIDVKDGFCGGL